MFWLGMGLGIVIGIVICFAVAWYYLRDFAIFKS